MESRFTVGDRVRIDISNETDPDHDRLHGCRGEITTILEEDTDEETGGERDSQLYRIQLETRETIDVRWRDIRPPIQ